MGDLTRWAEKRMDLPFDLVRIYLGVGLFVKGVSFIRNQALLPQILEESGNLWWVPAAVAHYVILAHLAGGLLLTLGFLTRLGALIQVPALLGAVFWVHLPKVLSIGSSENFEFSALVLFLLILIFAWGAGRLSVDARMSRSREA